jgi:hypothetical protein
MSVEQEVLAFQINKLQWHLEDEEDVIVEWEYGTMNAYYYEDDLIVVSTRLGLRSRLYVLLHEAGHYFLRKENKHNFPPRPNHGRTGKNYRTTVVYEEALAWDRGRRLAEELKIEIEEEKWQAYVNTQLYDYCRWAVDPKLFSEEQA